MCGVLEGRGSKHSAPEQAGRVFWQGGASAEGHRGVLALLMELWLRGQPLSAGIGKSL